MRLLHALAVGGCVAGVGIWILAAGTSPAGDESPAPVAARRETPVGAPSRKPLTPGSGVGVSTGGLAVPAPSGIRAPQRADCRHDRDCAPLERCVLGNCIDGQRDCRVDVDCGPGARCELGACLEGVRECPEPGCDADETCLFGTCLSSSEIACESDEDCGAGNRCVLARCFEGARDCKLDRDCGPDERCVFDRCVDGARACEVDTDCPEGSRCTFGTCTDGLRECTGARDCAEGERCHFGVCRPPDE